MIIRSAISFQALHATETNWLKTCLLSSHLQKLQALLDVLHLLLVVLDHLLHLLAVHFWMDCVCDVGWSRCHPTCRSYTNAYSCNDERRSCSEGRQNEAGDRSDGSCNTGHSTTDTGCDCFLMENVSCISQIEQLQDTLLEWDATLVEKVNKKTSRHEDTISDLFHHSETGKTCWGRNTEKELNKWISELVIFCKG